MPCLSSIRACSSSLTSISNEGKSGALKSCAVRPLLCHSRNNVRAQERLCYECATEAARLRFGEFRRPNRPAHPVFKIIDAIVALDWITPHLTNSKRQLAMHLWRRLQKTIGGDVKMPCIDGVPEGIGKVNLHAEEDQACHPAFQRGVMDSSGQIMIQSTGTMPQSSTVSQEAKDSEPQHPISARKPPLGSFKITPPEDRGSLPCRCLAC